MHNKNIPFQEINQHIIMLVNIGKIVDKIEINLLLHRSFFLNFKEQCLFFSLVIKPAM